MAAAHRDGLRVALAGLEERSDDGPMLGVGAGEQSILAGEGERPVSAFDDVVVDSTRPSLRNRYST